ncbi:MAG: phosphohistidine phosphatase SixA [Xenococcaceae cyanobacterium]
MELYLIRHGIAADHAAYTNDEARPLTDKGREKTKKVAQRLYDIGLRLDLILTSPLLRARQTAEILQDVGLSDQIEEFVPLAPNGDIQDWVSWWSKWSYNTKGSYLALVGHQPNLGNWTETLVWGNTKEQLVVKKAGVIGLKLPETGTPVGNSELFLLTSPKWLL